MRHIVLALGFAAASLAPRASADVLVVGPASLGGTHATIQAAVDAAADGDVILVAANSPGFTIDGKGLSVVGWPGLGAEVQGTIRVLDLPAGATVLLDGLAVNGSSVAPKAGSALELSSNLGQVRVHSCTLKGGQGTGYDGCASGSGGDAVVIDSSMGVVLKDCDLLGGKAKETGEWSCDGVRGGDGLRIASSVVALYGGTVGGGHGGQADGFPGDGGDGVRVESWGVFAAGTVISGGHCGYNPHGAGNGDGGDGLFLAAGTQARLLDVTLLGGSTSGTVGSGVSGQPTAGPGVVTILPGNHQSLHVGPLAAFGDRFEVDLAADPESEVWVFVSQHPSMRYVPGWSGFAAVPHNSTVTKAPAASVPWSGHLLLELQSPLPPGVAGAFWLQVLVRPPGGAPILSSPEAVVVLQSGSLLPDCNGNGAFDLSDLVDGTSEDCDENGVPDECEPPKSTWHVDPAAAAGGNGSPGAPFQTLKQAFLAASSCDTILLADGIYSGSANAGIKTFDISDLTLRSLNGSSACVIDLQGTGTYLWQYYGSGRVRFEGLTVLNALDSAIQTTGILASIEFVDCIFQNCKNGLFGGALNLNGGSVRVQGCRFTGNEAGTGGAIRCAGVSNLTVLDSIFEGNVAAGGAGIYSQSNSGYGPILDSPERDSLIARCSFLGNSSSGAGGAISVSEEYLRVESCLLAGNSAANGGALYINGPIEMNLCTIVGNSASNSGGAIRIGDSNAWDFTSLLANSIVWSNVSADGHLIYLDAQGGGPGLDVRFSDVEGGQAVVGLEPGATLLWGAGNLDLDPLFVDADGPDDDPMTLVDNDWRLASGSPCIDAGADPLLPQDLADQDLDGKRSEASPFDLDGAAREQDDPTAPDVGIGPAPIVDMGAYERP